MNRKRRQLLYGVLMAAGMPGTVRAAVCRATDDDALGPFHRRLAPFRSRLADPEEPGDPLVITGRVLSADRCTPLAGAVLDVWHADTRGQYYNVGARRDDEPEQYRLRGRVAANLRGEYRIRTIEPGIYGSRPRHIHFIVTHPGARRLVTQMYFSGDPRLRPYHLNRDSLIVDRKGAAVRFDIILAV